MQSLALQVQIALSSLSATLQAAQGRLDALEQMRIPSLEERLQDVSRTSAQVCLANLLGLLGFAQAHILLGASQVVV